MDGILLALSPSPWFSFLEMPTLVHIYAAVVAGANVMKPPFFIHKSYN